MANPSGPGFPGGGNTFIPIDISNRLRIGFSRDASKFHLPRYVQYVEVPKSEGYYLKLTAQEAGRVVDTQDFVWPDGTPDRLDASGTESFTFLPFITQRYRYGFRLGQRAVAQSVWPIVEQHAAIKSAQLMTARTVRVLTAATTVSNWQQVNDSQNLSADHTNTATAIGGGLFDSGSSTSPYLKNGLDDIAHLINRDTLGTVDSSPGRYYVIMNPNTARQIASSPEIHDYLKGSYWVMQELTTGQSRNGRYGLPDSLYGYAIIVENAVRVTTRRGNTQTRTYAMPDQTILVCSRPGELDGIYGAPSFSTLSLFWFQDEMTVETQSSEWDRLVEGRVIEDTYEAVTCPASGYLITSATATPN